MTEKQRADHESDSEKYEVSVGLVTTVSTTANASFDHFVTEFTRRISDKAAEVFGEDREHINVPKGT